MKKLLQIIILIPFLLSCGDDSVFIEDQNIWEYASPSTTDLDEGMLLELDEGIKLQNFGNVQGLIIIKNDQLVFENYYQGSSRVDLQPIGRLGAGLVTALFGEVLNNELGNQVDTPIHELLPEYSDVFDADPVKKEITIRHLLTVRTGLVWNESLRTVLDDDNDLVRMTNSDDYVGYILNKQIEAPPGRRFSYNSGCHVLLVKLMDELLDRPVTEYFNERLFEPLGIERFELSNTPQGLPDYALGLRMSTLDLTKVGYFIMQKGNWRGRRLLDDRWIDQLLSIQVEISDENHFGFGWWGFGDASTIANIYGIDDINYLFSERSSGMYLSESQDMLVVVSNGLDPNRSFSNSSFWTYVRVLDALPLSML